jgi:DNA-binding MarR family transcriptional regulator
VKNRIQLARRKGLFSTSSVIILLAACEEPGIRVSALARETGTTAQSVSQQITRLRQLGFLEEATGSPNDPKHPVHASTSGRILAASLNNEPATTT